MSLPEDVVDSFRSDDLVLVVVVFAVVAVGTKSRRTDSWIVSRKCLSSPSSASSLVSRTGLSNEAS